MNLFRSFLIVLTFAFSLHALIGTDTTYAFPSCIIDTGSIKVIEINSTASCHTLTGTIDENNGPIDVFLFKVTDDMNISYIVENTQNNNLRYSVSTNSSCSSSYTTVGDGLSSSSLSDIEITGTDTTAKYITLYLESIENNQDTTYSVTIGSCSGGGGGGVDEGMGNGDFIDTSITTSALSSAYNASADTSSFGLKFIKTKIASQTTPLTAVYLNDFGISVDYDNNASGDEDSKLWFAIPVLNNLDVTGACPSANSSLLQQIIDPTTNKQVIFTVKDLGTADYSQTKNVVIPSNASKNAKIEMILVDTSKLSEDAQNCVEVSSQTGNLEGLGQCVNSEVQYVDAYGQTAYDRCAVSGTYGQPCLPQNNGVGTGLFNSPLGCFMCTFYAGTTCSSDNFAIRPEQFDNNLTLGQVLIADNNTSISFHANRYGGVGTLDYDESEIQTTPSFVIDANISDPTKNCQQPSMNFTPRITFADGNVTGNFSLPNVGDLNVTMHEIVGSEFAFVDTDDTPLVDRLITPYTQQIQVIPHHFGIDGNLTNGSNGFTYLSNFEEHNTTIQNRTISASLDLNVSAQRADNNITSNYTQECYAKDGNITLTLNAITVTPLASDGNSPLSKLLWYRYDNDGNTSGWIDLNTTVPPYVIPFLSTQFDSNDTNGTAEFNYKINFDRNVTKVVNPFMVVVTDINATDVDAVNGTNSVDSNATFLFGRTHASRQRYEGPTGTANIYFESYCFTGCDKTLLNGFSPSMLRTDDVRWYINEAHVLTNDGLAGAVSEKATSVKVTATPLTTTNPPPQTTTLTYNPTNSGYPYKTTMENNASNWLIQNETNPIATTNEFQVEFNNQGDWTGENETSTTTKDSNTSITNRRIMW